jgi:hypothetical protein
VRGALNLVTFPDLMERMDGTFPLRGLRRVAVVGAGDSGKTAIEALSGQGPCPGWSPASSTTSRRSTGTACPTTSASGTVGGVRPLALPRHRGPAAAALGGESRVTPLGSAASLSTGYDMAFVDDRPYDLVVDCRGYTADRPPPTRRFDDFKAEGGRTVGTSLTTASCTWSGRPRASRSPAGVDRPRR